MIVNLFLFNHLIHFNFENSKFLIFYKYLKQHLKWENAIYDNQMDLNNLDKQYHQQISRQRIIFSIILLQKYQIKSRVDVSSKTYLFFEYQIEFCMAQLNMNLQQQFSHYNFESLQIQVQIYEQKISSNYEIHSFCYFDYIQISLYHNRIQPLGKTIHQESFNLNKIMRIMFEEIFHIHSKFTLKLN